MNIFIVPEKRKVSCLTFKANNNSVSSNYNSPKNMKLSPNLEDKINVIYKDSKPKPKKYLI